MEKPSKFSKCVWSYDDYDDTWSSTCDGDNIWQFPDCGPAENGMKYCPFCGRILVQKENEYGG